MVQAEGKRGLTRRDILTGTTASAVLLATVVACGSSSSRPAECFSPAFFSGTYQDTNASANNRAAWNAIFIPNRPGNSVQQGQTPNGYEGVQFGYQSPPIANGPWHESTTEQPAEDQDNYLLVGPTKVQFSVRMVALVGSALCSEKPTDIAFPPTTESRSSLPKDAHGQTWPSGVAYLGPTATAGVLDPGISRLPPIIAN